MCKILVTSASPFLSRYLSNEGTLSKRDIGSARRLRSAIKRKPSRPTSSSSSSSVRRRSLPAIAPDAKVRRNESGRGSGRGFGRGYSSDNECDDTRTRSNNDVVLGLISKSGMGQFRNFLNGTAGERSLLYWLDAEHINSCSDEQDIQRYGCL